MSRTLALLLFVCFSFATAPVAAQREGGPDRPITVDCTRGDSLQRALLQFPERTDRITIDLHGFCEGPVDIRRAVRIRGTDAATDGITGGASLGIRTGLVVVFGVSGFGVTGGDEVVRLEHLTIKDSPNLGLTVNVAQVGLSDVVVRDNTGHGVLAFPAAAIYADHVTATGNGGSGIATRGGQIQCAECEISNNGLVLAGAPAVGASMGLTVLTHSVVSGVNGILVTNGGDFGLNGGTVTATQRALNIQSAGRVFAQDGAALSGSVLCGAQGLLDSRRGPGASGLTQTSTAAGGANQITNACLFLAGPGTTTLVGQTTISSGGFVATEGGSQATVKFNALNCATGGKVTTSGGSVVVNNVPGIPAGCGV